MPRLIVHGFTISLDGYGAGPQQSLEAPLGLGAEALHDRFCARVTSSRTLRHTHSSKQPSNKFCLGIRGLEWYGSG